MVIYRIKKINKNIPLGSLLVWNVPVPISKGTRGSSIPKIELFHQDEALAEHPLLTPQTKDSAFSDPPKLLWVCSSRFV